MARCLSFLWGGGSVTHLDSLTCLGITLVIPQQVIDYKVVGIEVVRAVYAPVEGVAVDLLCPGNEKPILFLPKRILDGVVNLEHVSTHVILS